jgi:hypothetical protein
MCFQQGNNAGLASTERLKAFINGSERLTSDTELRVSNYFDYCMEAKMIYDYIVMFFCFSQIQMKRARDSSSCSDVSWQPKKHHPDSSNDD